MRVRVRLLGGLRDYLAAGREPFDDAELDFAAGETVGGLASALGFRAETQFLAMRNGEHVPDDAIDRTALAEGDTVTFIPPIKGG